MKNNKLTYLLLFVDLLVHYTFGTFIKPLVTKTSRLLHFLMVIFLVFLSLASFLFMNIFISLESYVRHFLSIFFFLSHMTTCSTSHYFLFTLFFTLSIFFSLILFLIFFILFAFKSCFVLTEVLYILVFFSSFYT